MKKLILASASPRRKELLENAGLSFQVQVSDVDESVFSHLPPEEMVQALAKAKAEAVAKENRDSLVIGSDTVVVLENKVLGKPADRDDAFRMLSSLSGKTHYVYTGVCITDGRADTFVSKTAVTFFELTKEEIEGYVATGEPMDKAGAYGIQGRGSLLVKEISGDYFTVVGLPVAMVARKINNRRRAASNELR